MAHRVLVYNVRMHPVRKTDDYVEFGDYDGQGIWLGSVIQTVLAGVSVTSTDPVSSTTFEGALHPAKRDCIGATFTAGRGGVTSTFRAPGQSDFHRTKRHQETMRTAVLLHLPKRQTQGRLLVHSAHGHSAKAAVEPALRSHARSLGFVLEIEPVVPTAALRKAAEDGRIDKVTLVKYQRRTGDGFDDLAKWGEPEEVGKIRLVVPSRRNNRLRSDPLRRFLGDPTPGNREDMVEFNGARFDDVEVTVDMADGTQRTFSLGQPSGGHALSEIIDVRDSTALGPSSADLLAALERNLATPTA